MKPLTQKNYDSVVNVLAKGKATEKQLSAAQQFITAYRGANPHLFLEERGVESPTPSAMGRAEGMPAFEKATTDIAPVEMEIYEKDLERLKPHGMVPGWEPSPPPAQISAEYEREMQQGEREKALQEAASIAYQARTDPGQLAGKTGAPKAAKLTRMLKSLAMEDKLGIRQAEKDPNNRSATQISSVYVPPEIKTKGAGLGEIEYWPEPQLEEFRKEMSTQLGADVIDLDEDSEEYKFYSDLKWKQFVEDQGGQQYAKPLKRKKFADMSIMEHVSAEAMPWALRVERGVAGALPTEIGGALAEATGMVDPQTVEKLREVRESATAGWLPEIAGALHGASPASKIYGATGRIPGFGTGVMPQGIRGTLRGAATAAGEGAVADIGRLGSELIQGEPKRALEEAQQMPTSGAHRLAMGAAFGLGTEALGRTFAGGVKMKDDALHQQAARMRKIKESGAKPTAIGPVELAPQQRKMIGDLRGRGVEPQDFVEVSAQDIADPMLGRVQQIQKSEFAAGQAMEQKVFAELDKMGAKVAATEAIEVVESALRVGTEAPIASQPKLREFFKGAHEEPRWVLRDSEDASKFLGQGYRLRTADEMKRLGWDMGEPPIPKPPAKTVLERDFPAKWKEQAEQLAVETQPGNWMIATKAKELNARALTRAKREIDAQAYHAEKLDDAPGAEELRRVSDSLAQSRDRLPQGKELGRMKFRVGDDKVVGGLSALKARERLEIMSRQRWQRDLGVPERIETLPERVTGMEGSPQAALSATGEKKWLHSLMNVKAQGTSRDSNLALFEVARDIGQDDFMKAYMGLREIAGSDPGAAFRVGMAGGLLTPHMYAVAPGLGSKAYAFGRRLAQAPIIKSVKFGTMLDVFSGVKAIKRMEGQGVPKHKLDRFWRQFDDAMGTLKEWGAATDELALMDQIREQAGELIALGHLPEKMLKPGFRELRPYARQLEVQSGKRLAAMEATRQKFGAPFWERAGGKDFGKRWRGEPRTGIEITEAPSEGFIGTMMGLRGGRGGKIAEMTVKERQAMFEEALTPENMRTMEEMIVMALPEREQGLTEQAKQSLIGGAQELLTPAITKALEKTPIVAPPQQPQGAEQRQPR